MIGEATSLFKDHHAMCMCLLLSVSVKEFRTSVSIIWGSCDKNVMAHFLDNTEYHSSAVINWR